jgi:hypothetical protein
MSSGKGAYAWDMRWTPGWISLLFPRRHRHRRRRPQPPPACPDGFLYAVGPGERLAELSARFQVGRAELAAANPQVANWDRLVPGQLLCVPAGGPFEVCLLLKRTAFAPAAAAGVVLARRDPAAGVQLLVATAGLPGGGGEARFERDGEVYLTLPLREGSASVREPGGALTRFEHIAVVRDERVLLEGWGRDCLPAPPMSAVGPG